MNEQFIEDYKGPSLFYRLLANRNKTNPLYLKRLLKRKIKSNIIKQLKIKINHQLLNKDSKLIVILLSIPLICNSKDHIIIHDMNESIIHHNGKSKKILLDFKSINLNNYIQLVVILNGSKEYLTSLFNDVMIYNLLDKIIYTTNYNEIYYNIFELISKSPANAQSNYLSKSHCNINSNNTKYKIHSKLVNNRFKFIPYSHSKQLITLINTSESNKNESVNIEISMKWIYQTNNDNIYLTNNQQAYDFSNYNIILHYVYYNKTLGCNSSLIETKHFPICPWCNYTICSFNKYRNITNSVSNYFSEIDSNNSASYANKYRNELVNVISIYVNHLINNHLHYQYEVFVDHTANYHIVIRRHHKEDDDESKISQYKYYSFTYWGKHIRNQLFYYENICNLIDLNEQSNTSIDTSNGITNGNDNNYINEIFIPNKQYYHSRLGLTILDDELNYDSDNDIDISYDISTKTQALEEFEDVSYEEKELMKLWNIFLTTHPIYSDRYTSYTIESFVDLYAYDIINKNLRHNFLLHLINLWDYGLISKEDIDKCMSIIDKLKSR